MPSNTTAESITVQPDMKRHGSINGGINISTVSRSTRVTSMIKDTAAFSVAAQLSSNDIVGPGQISDVPPGILHASSRQCSVVVCRVLH